MLTREDDIDDHAVGRRPATPPLDATQVVGATGT
jgi:hypothetical protein